MSSHRVVAFNDFLSGDLTDELDASRRVLNSGRLILGSEVQQFESAWAKRCGVDHAVGVGNGLDAIEIGLRALEIGPGDEVVTSPMTAVATVLAIIRSGATPVLADIDPDTGLLNPDSVERCISPRTKAVLLVHLYGQMRDMEHWNELCRSYDIHLIEDCAQSHDAKADGLAGGAWGTFGAYSFYPTKNLGAAGDAGAIVTNDSNLSALARSLRNYGQANRYEHPHIGLNSRLDELQAAILSVRLPRLTGWTARRREIAKIYRDEIDNAFVSMLAPPIAPENHAYHLFVVTTEYRAELQEHLAQRNVETLIHYPIPAHRQPPLAQVARDQAGLRMADAHSQQCLSLPCAPHLTNDDVARVVTEVNNFRPK